MGGPIADRPFIVVCTESLPTVTILFAWQKSPLPISSWILTRHALVWSSMLLHSARTVLNNLLLHDQQGVFSPVTYPPTETTLHFLVLPVMVTHFSRPTLQLYPLSFA